MNEDERTGDSGAPEDVRPLTSDDTEQQGPEPSEVAEVEGALRVTGERLPSDVSPPEETEAGTPKEVVDPGVSAMPVHQPAASPPTSDEELQKAREGTVAEAPPAAAERPARPERPAGERPARPERAAAPVELPAPPPGSVYDVFQDVLPGVPFKAGMGFNDVLLTVRPQELTQVLTTARKHPRLDFDYLRCLTCVDQEAAGIEIVYQLYSFSHQHNVAIKSLLPPDRLWVDSVTKLWKAADWFERELWEMFGVDVIGHPDLKPLLLEDETVYLHPLLKSTPLQDIELKQGVGVAGDGEDEDGE